jgi:hypothetical protein
MSLPAQTSTWTKANYQSATAADIAGLSLAQVAALQHPDWLPPAAIAGFSAAQLGAIAISWAWMNAAWINALTPAATAGIPASGIAALTGATLGGLDAAHLGALTGAQINALGNSLIALAPAAMTGLAPAILAKLTGAQIATFTPAQVAALLPKQLAALGAGQAAWLTEGQVLALGAKVQALSAAALSALGNANLVAVYRQLSAAQIAALPAAQAAAIALAVKTSASLTTTLTTAGLLGDVKAVVAGGTSLFGYKGVLAVLDALDAQIGSAGLTAAQLADLKTYAKAVGTVDGTGSYVYGVLKDVVGSNAFNANWTNGAAKPAALGNLAVGSSAAQFNELIGKWLLGTDNPAWNPGTATSFSTGNTLLFGSTGIAASDPSQGGIGDCYLIAAVVAVALDQPGLIDTMFTDNGNGTYGVRFYAPGGTATYVTVSDALPKGGWTAHTPSGTQWVTLLEKAYVTYMAEFSGTANAWSAISGGWDGGLSAITGKADTVYMCAYTSSKSAWETSVDKAVLTALGAGEEVLYASFIDDKGANGKTDLVSDHMFAVIGYDQTTGDFILRNPWGAAGGSSWNGQFEQSIDQLWGGTSGTTADSGFIVASGNSPAGATNPALAATHLVHAMASMGATGGSGHLAPVMNLASAAGLIPTLVAGHA